MNIESAFKKTVGLTFWHKLRETYQLRKVEKTDDSRRLMRMWRKSSYENVRFGIVNTLQDQGLMAVIARGDPSDGVRAEAVKRLTDKRLLQRIFLTDKSAFVRTVAQAHLEYSGPEPWLTAEEDEEARKDILDYLMRHAAPVVQKDADGDAMEPKSQEHDQRKKRMLRHRQAAK